MQNDEIIYAEISQTPRAIRETIELSKSAAHTIAQELRARSIQRLFLIGNGTSYYSSLAAGYTARQLAKPGTPQVYPMMAGDFRYYTPALGEQDAIIGISASGEFRDVLEVFERFQAKVPCIGITQVPGSSITRLTGYLLYGGGGPSRVSVMTKTYASTLTAAHLLLLDAIIKQLGEAGLTNKKMKFVIPKSHLFTIETSGAFYTENFYGGHTFYWTLQDKFPKAKKFVEDYMKKHGAPPSKDSDGGYVGTRALLEAMNVAKTTTDVDKLIKTLKGFKMDYNKGPEEFRACDHIRTTSVVIVRGIGAKASGMNYGEVVAEIPWQETLESCETNKNDVPYGKVILRILLCRKSCLRQF